MIRPLEKITVLDLTSGHAGALASMMLTDFGARTLRAVYAEAPLFREGGFVIWDRGKEAINLDVSSPKGQLELDRLLPGIDVLIEDFAPSSPLQALVDMERLKVLNPRLVACSITAFGRHGPLKDEPPLDDLVMARTGLLGSVPGFRGTPVHLVHRLPSVGAALTACCGIGASLFAREDTGRGRKVETSLMTGALVYTPKCVGERIDRQIFQHHPCGTEPFFGVYQCSDGRYLNPGCVHGGFITACAGMLGLSDLLAEPRFNNGRMGMSPKAERELRDAIAAVFKTRPSAEWAEALTKADIPFAHVLDDEACLEDPQTMANGSVATFEDPQYGSVTQMGTLSRFFETLNSDWVNRYAGKPEHPLADQQQYGLNAFHRLYQVRDGWLYVAADNAAEQASLKAWFGVGDLAPDGDGHPAESPLAIAMADALAQKSLADAMQGLHDAGVPAIEAQPGDSELFLEDPHASANDLIEVCEQPRFGRFQLLKNFIQFSDTARPKVKPLSVLGEQTADVLAEAGLTAIEIETLFDNGAAVAENISCQESK